MAHKQREPRSSYARQHKAPYRYSDRLLRMARIRQEGGGIDAAEYIALDTAHRAEYGLLSRREAARQMWTPEGTDA